MNKSLCEIIAWFSLDASVSISTSKITKGKRHVMTFKDKAKWFSFEMSFVLAQAPSTRTRVNLKPGKYFHGYAYRPHVTG